MKLGLIIYGSLDTMSGGYLYDRKLVAYLQEQGDEVKIISLPWRNYLSHLSDNLYFHLPAGLDILIEDELNHPSLLAANSKKHTYPVVCLVHNLHSSEKRPSWQNWFIRAVERAYLRSADSFIFNSKMTRTSVYTLLENEHPEEKPFIIATPGGDRLGSLTPQEVNARAVAPGPLRLLFLANVTPLKGLNILLDALNGQNLDFQLDVVGSLKVAGDYASDMQQFIIANGMQQRVTFHGVLDGDLLIDKIKKAHVLVIPSFYEGFGISYLEGMAFGLPAIGTTSGAIPQLISNGENGYMIKPGDSKRLAKHLNDLVSDRELLARLSLNALQQFKLQPTWKQSAEAIRSFLLNMVNGWS
jgi:glycosyltransferase involved in cell wall biosynthesis